MSTTTASELAIDNRVGYPLYDADEHYYEPKDAMTRHLAKQFQRNVRWVEIDGRQRLLLGDQLFSRQPNAAYDPIAKPGSLVEFFRGHNPEGRDVRDLLGEEEPTRPEYRDRDVRLKVMDSHGVEATLILPSFGLYIEEHFKRTPETLYAILDSYNQWLDEDWGFAYHNRIFSGPVLSLIDPEKALAQLTWARDRGARFIVLRPGPVTDGTHSYSLGNTRHDPIWAALAEAGMFAVFHAADAGYEADAERWEESDAVSFASGALTEMLGLHTDRPIQETIAALISHRVFERHPALRVATIELGSRWALDLFDRMKSAYKKQPQLFAEDPAKTFCEHVWISPHYEDDLIKLRDRLGAGHILFGSDWPHPEGLTVPADYSFDVQPFSPEERKMILADNLRGLLGI
ncbi:MAG: hypothetical protein JWL70_2212 [Acidimicrobiia bacterium]|nr:hypothetical protein [Acidimicrobiia bacterium]